MRNCYKRHNSNPHRLINLSNKNYYAMKNIIKIHSFQDISTTDYAFANNSNEMSYGTASNSRIAEVPVENVFSKSQIETLEWQLKQVRLSCGNI